MSEKREELQKMIELLGEAEVQKAWNFIILLLTENSGLKVDELRKISESGEDFKKGKYISLDKLLEKLELNDE